MSSPITISARIRADDVTFKALDIMASTWGVLERRLFVEKYARGELSKDDNNKLKVNWLIKHQLTSMQFNGLDRQLGGKMAATKECLSLAKDSIATKITRTKKEIVSIQKDLRLRAKNNDTLAKKNLLADSARSDAIRLNKKDRFTLHQKKRRLYNLTQKLTRLEARKDTSICFGSRKLFRAQFHLESNGLKDQAEWKNKWQASRNNQFLCLGMAAASRGNSSCFFTEIETSSHSIKGILTVRSFAGLSPVRIPIEFTHSTEHLAAALAANSAITYRFLRKGTRWYVYASLDRITVPIMTNIQNGFLGADMNKGHLACARIKSDGNLVDAFDLDYRFQPGESSNRRKERLQLVVNALVSKALETKTPIVIEKLDFTKKKKELKSRGYNRMLSSFIYSRFNSMVHSRSQKYGAQVIEVNPANSSIIGYWKFGRGMGLTIHQSAAFAIARRGATTFSSHDKKTLVDGILKTKKVYVPHVRFSERLKAYPSKNPPPSPARIMERHVWRDWREYPPIFKRKEKPSCHKGNGRGRLAKASVTTPDDLDYFEGLRHPGTGNTPVPGNLVNLAEGPNSRERCRPGASCKSDVLGNRTKVRVSHANQGRNSSAK